MRKTPTYGGYSDRITVHVALLVVHIPDGIPLDKAAQFHCYGAGS